MNRKLSTQDYMVETLYNGASLPNSQKCHAGNLKSAVVEAFTLWDMATFTNHTIVLFLLESVFIFLFSLKF